MRILITNHHLQHVGGTEKWVYAMACELRARQHDVEVFTFMRGMTSEKLEEAGISVIDNPFGRYDLCMVNHGTCLAVVRAKCQGPVVFTSHGPHHPLEFPGPGADYYVGVSEEVRATHIQRGYDMQVIRNGIDLQEFCPGPVNDREPRVLSMCKGIDAGAIVEAAAHRCGLNFFGVHYLGKPAWDMAREIRYADLVFACGRSAYEALACGKTVVVFDHRSAGLKADGLLTAENIGLVAQCNCSGRYGLLDWRMEDVERAMQEYAPSPWAREWAKCNVNIVEKADQYLRFAEGA